MATHASVGPIHLVHIPRRQTSMRLWPADHRPLWLNAVVASGVFLVLSLVLAPTRVFAAEPPQPVQLQVLYRSGQTFVTWQERADLVGERYRIYRHSAPISQGNVAQAALLYEVPEGTAWFFANRYKTYGTPAWKPRYVERYVIQDRGPELAEGTGLLVWTLSAVDLSGSPAGTGYYAVTTVLSDTENLVDWSANVAGPVAESLADPRPVAIDANVPQGWQVFIQYMDLRDWNPTFHAPRADNSYYGLAADALGVTGALQYAYDYAVYVPPVSPEDTGKPLPVVFALHAWQDNAYGPPSGNTAQTWPAYQIRPIDQSETWWFGFARQHDFRTRAQPGPGDTVVNYTEYRILRMLHDLVREPLGPPVDEERVYMYGHSMGASGALAIALRYPNRFAAAYAAKPMTNYRDAGGWEYSVASKWGSKSVNLPIRIIAPSDAAAPLHAYQGLGVWDWQNHQANLASRRSDDLAPLGISQSLNDTSLPWATQGAPLYGLLDASGQCWAASIREDGHNWVSFKGLPVALAQDGHGIPFVGLRVVRGETVPGLSRANLDVALPPTRTVELNQSVLWSSSWMPWDGAPIDQPQVWRMSLCAVAAATEAPGWTAGVTQTVDLTPRRVQRFYVAPGMSYHWSNCRVADGTLVAHGQVHADENGQITLRDQEVTPTGNRITL